MKRAALTALAIAAAVVVGRATVSTPESTHTERVIEHRSVEPSAVQASGLTAAEVRDIVRTELAQQAPAAAAAPESPPADDAALARAHAAVDAGLADGRWTNEDREQLRREFVLLPQAQAEEILRTLFTSLPRVKVEVDGPAV